MVRRSFLSPPPTHMLPAPTAFFMRWLKTLLHRGVSAVRGTRRARGLRHACQRAGTRASSSWHATASASTCTWALRTAAEVKVGRK